VISGYQTRVSRLLDQLVLPGERLATKVAGDTSVGSVTDRLSDVVPGCAFFAIRGRSVDGHGFVAEALSRGAALAVVDREQSYLSHDRVAQVPCTRAALARAACRWHGDPSSALRLVGVTGTNGKSTTTYLLRQAWDGLGLASGLIGTVETWVGERRMDSALTTPDALTLQSLFADMRDARASLGAVEVSSIALDQSRTLGTRFAVGVFTNLTRDHLDYHGDMEAYLRSKLSLFEEHAVGASVVNLDDPAGAKLYSRLEGGIRLGISWTESSAAIRVLGSEPTPHGVEAVFATPQGEISLRSPLVGRHNVTNLATVLGACLALEIPLAGAARALESASGAPGRLERVPTPEGGPRVFVDYAHSEDALENVLRSLRQWKGGGPGRILTVFGCGGDRDRGKRPRMAAVASAWSDVTVVTSDNPRTEDPLGIVDEIAPGLDRRRTEAHLEVDRGRAIGLALGMAGPDDWVLIAGKGHETYQIVGTRKIAFDDRQVVRDHYRR